MDTLPLASSIACKQENSMKSCAAALSADVKLKSGGEAATKMSSKSHQTCATMQHSCRCHIEPFSAAHAEIGQSGDSCLRTHRSQAAGRQLAGVSSPRPAHVQRPGEPDAGAPPQRPLHHLAPWQQLQQGLGFLRALIPRPLARGRCGDS